MLCQLRCAQSDIWQKKSSKELSDMAIEKFPVQGMKELFINENLTVTQQLKKLLWLTKQKQESLNKFGLITAK